jgi:hypothetical protein
MKRRIASTLNYVKVEPRPETTFRNSPWDLFLLGWINSFPLLVPGDECGGDDVDSDDNSENKKG